MPVYIFGSGDCGQLGMGEDMFHVMDPWRCPFFNDKQIISVSAGGLHSLALSSRASYLNTPILYFP